MSKKLAIRGHSARGKEIIELLEMMGGINKNMLSAHIGDVLNPHVYFLELDSSDNRIVWNYLLGLEWDGRASDMMIFTLEEFLEKYPFKVGDKVIDSKTGKIAEVYKIHWSENNSCVYYDIKYPNNRGCQRKLMDLQPYKEEPNMKESITINMSAIDYNNGLVGYEIPEGYEFDTVIDNKVVLKKLKPTYPTTYKECCDVLKIPNDECYIDIDVPLDYNKLLSVFTELLICRKAYYKIAGEQMGLDKYWKPDWKNAKQKKYCIYSNEDYITKCVLYYANAILSFPTLEMRDAFYKNFKDLIEQCKELL